MCAVLPVIVGEARGTSALLWKFVENPVEEFLLTDACSSRSLLRNILPITPEFFDRHVFLFLRNRENGSFEGMLWENINSNSGEYSAFSTTTGLDLERWKIGFAPNESHAFFRNTMLKEEKECYSLWNFVFHVKFARRTESVHRAFIREILAVTEDQYYFLCGRGLTSFFPVEEFQKSAHNVLVSSGREALQIQHYRRSTVYENFVSDGIKKIRELTLIPMKFLLPMVLSRGLI